MQKHVEYSTRAKNNLTNIKEFIALDNVSAATRVIESIIEAADGLAEFSTMGKTGEIAGTRELVISKYPYTIIYRLTADKVRVIAVLHQSQTMK
jgi:addiction module RelE/StbE family toxin